MTRRAQRFMQDLLILPYDHPAPGQSGSLSAAAATGLLTLAAKAQTTSGDFFILNDGQRLYGFELNTTGATASHFISPVAATGLLTCAAKAAVVDGDYYLLNDGHRIYGFEMDPTGAVAAHAVVPTAATGLLTCDTKAQTTSGDYYLLSDGHRIYGFELNTTGAVASHAIAPTAAACQLAFDTKAQTTDGDHFFLNDGHRVYGFELQTAGTTPLHAIAATAATAQLAFDTKANTTSGDFFILNDGHRLYGFELNTTGAVASHAIAPTAATGEITCDTKANTTDDDFFLLNDGSQIWAVVLDQAGNGSALANGTDYFVDDGAELVVDISGATTANDVSALLQSALAGADIQMTATDTFGDVALRQDNVGPQGNTQQSGLGTLSNAWAVTDMSGGLDADVNADIWTVVNISSATSAVDVATLVHGVINGIAILITSVDPTSGGVLNLTNDEVGRHGNTVSVLSETGSTLLAVPNMAGALDADVNADVWTVVDLTTATDAVDVATLVHTVINGTDIGITSVDPTSGGVLNLTNDEPGVFGNTQQTFVETGSTLFNVPNMAGALDADVVADVWTVVDINTATTAADVSALIDASINGTDIQMTSVDGGGTCALTNDDTGRHGNTQQTYSETGGTLMDLTDMSGALGPDVNADVWTVVDVSTATTNVQVAALVHTAVNGTDIQITSVDNADGTLGLTNDETGPFGNTQQQLSETGATAMDLTDMTGGQDADVNADVMTVIDLSSGTTAIDLAALCITAINGTDIQMTAAAPTSPDGTAELTNDDLGPVGNTQQQLSETGSTALALTDMTGGVLSDVSGATMATKLFTAQRAFKVVKVEYINPTGLAGHGSNYWEIGIKKGATVMAQWSTDSDVAAEGTLGADTVNECTLSSTLVNRVADQDDVISFFATKVASAANLPAGRLVIHGRYL